MEIKDIIKYWVEELFRFYPFNLIVKEIKRNPSLINDLKYSALQSPFFAYFLPSLYETYLSLSNKLISEKKHMRYEEWMTLKDLKKYSLKLKSSKYSNNTKFPFSIVVDWIYLVNKKVYHKKWRKQEIRKKLLYLFKNKLKYPLINENGRYFLPSIYSEPYIFPTYCCIGFGYLYFKENYNCWIRTFRRHGYSYKEAQNFMERKVKDKIIPKAIFYITSPVPEFILKLSHGKLIIKFGKRIKEETNLIEILSYLSEEEKQKFYQVNNLDKYKINLMSSISLLKHLKQPLSCSSFSPEEKVLYFCFNYIPSSIFDFPFILTLLEIIYPKEYSEFMKMFKEEGEKIFSQLKFPPISHETTEETLPSKPYFEFFIFQLILGTLVYSLNIEVVPSGKKIAISQEEIKKSLNKFFAQSEILKRKPEENEF